MFQIFFIWPKSKKRPRYGQKNVFFYQKLQFIVFLFKILISTLLKISLLFPNSSPRGPKIFFLQKIVLEPLLTPFSHPTSFSGADKLQIAGWGNNLGVREARGIFAPPPDSRFLSLAIRKDLTTANLTSSYWLSIKEFTNLHFWICPTSLSR